MLYKIFLLGAVAGAMYACNTVGETPDSDRTGAAPPSELPSGMVYIPGKAGEGIADFYMDATEVTVGEFARFVEATGYQTEADSFGWSGVFDLQQLAWLPVEGANWRYPKGPDAAAAHDDEPVTQVSLRDAHAYARWTGGRLPSEREWMWAATQGGQQPLFPWGDKMIPNGEYPGNWWQGPFPYHNEVADGYRGVAATASFPPAANGLYDISGNVWEWTATTKPAALGQAVIKGGSFLCSTSYCTGFDLRQRQLTPADSGLNHLGFRTIREVQAKK